MHADKSSHAAIIKGSKRVCVKSILNKPVVLVGMEDDGDLGEIVGTLRATIQKTKMLESKLRGMQQPRRNVRRL